MTPQNKIKTVMDNFEIKQYECGQDLSQLQDGDRAVSLNDVLNIDFKRIILTCAKPADMIREKIKHLPTVTLQPKTGRWIIHDEIFEALGISARGGVECSACKYRTHNHLHYVTGFAYKFCPNCGARMVELQESEE